ncbi:ImuA family protein [Pelagibacterium lacus]|uniref:Protein ImuA n=1 Tax=Pelagibacterium lacus TaxID=2282655 RepID=A0A369W2Q5_9HYPH|nr:hypothetical protein [Pelagibacterium lacus]RDE08319.1 hypothetical protein DVH29_11965 [Pelagibacterium lacus]
MDKARRVGALRQALASLDPVVRTGQNGLISLGAGPVDTVLGGGLARGAVHEIFAERPADLAAASCFAGGVAARMEKDRPLLWVRSRKAQEEAGFLYGHGLAEMGIAARDMILVVVEDVVEGLRVGVEALRCAGLGAVVLEFWGHSRHLDLTASRRLALAVENGAAMGLVLRVAGEPAPSAAVTRWAVAPAPSSDPYGLPGRPTLSARLLRQRGAGALGHWHLEWNHATQAFGFPALSGAVVAPVVDRQNRAQRRAGWARTG